MKQSTRSREAYFLDFAQEVRQENRIPLMVTGGFRTRSVCEEALTMNQLDVIGFGRPFLLDGSFPAGFLDRTLDKIEEPAIKIIDPKNTDAAEAGFYDFQVKRLASGKPLSFEYNALQVALRIPTLEMRLGLRNWFADLIGHRY